MVQLGNKLKRFCVFDALYNGYLSIHETVGFSEVTKPLNVHETVGFSEVTNP